MFALIDISPLLFTLSVVAFCSCSGNSGAETRMGTDTDTDTIPYAVKELMRSVTDNDSAAFARIVSYPLERPYPLRDIEDSVQMKSYYSTLVDDSLHSVISKASSGDWESAGWRGWSMRKGDYVWVDESVYEIPYMSKKEMSDRHKLAALEIKSLSPDLRGPWIPEGCLIDNNNGTIYRIDSDSTITDDGVAEKPMYRLAIYRKGDNLRKRPAKVLKGHKHTEGSAGGFSYIFSEAGIAQSDSATYMIEAYGEEDGRPSLYHRKQKHPLSRIYWLDEISKDSMTNKALKTEKRHKTNKAQK
ncbi:MAG: hypothetical protein NC204_01045 [Candidatus Amulumruptor caecigallinarius]|nr:hypothetical protein [Candidatus Amulumruptor caecigallinarius]